MTADIKPSVCIYISVSHKTSDDKCGGQPFSLCPDVVKHVSRMGSVFHATLMLKQKEK